ncbi:MAG: undecaprenyldiphospho-muramoylpentapeptide beta-N-acetylglucosaminyltransferase [Pseudohongiellaceae bacterium]
MNNTQRILIMAAGTGGHVFPALAVARRLQAKGAQVEWMASEHGMENKLLHQSGITLHRIAVSGLQGKGLMRKLAAPAMLLRALFQSLSVLRRLRPACVLGMGGYISGPGGVAARLLGIPLVLHEQNAVPGFTNARLQRSATLVLEAFAGTFAASGKGRHTGNPLRQDISRLHGSLKRDYLVTPPATPAAKPATPSATTTATDHTTISLRILVLGGSLGARVLNETVPDTLRDWQGDSPPYIWHQTGSSAYKETVRRYTENNLTDSSRFRIDPFIDDMAEAYSWADLAVCRAGASTVSELAAVRLPSILVPYPHHRDKQQLHNARWLCRVGAGRLLEQQQLNATTLLDCLRELDANRSLLQTMSKQAGVLAILDADERIADCCLEAGRNTDLMTNPQASRNTNKGTTQETNREAPRG